MYGVCEALCKQESGGSKEGIVIGRIFQQRFVQFAIVGGVVFVIAFALLAFLVEAMGLDEITANVIATLLALELSFFLSKHLWKERAGSFFAQWVKFHGMKAGILILNQIIYIALVSSGAHYLLVILGLTLVETLLSFFGNDRFTFRGKDTL
jgi:putative flippase GtrA